MWLGLSIYCAREQSLLAMFVRLAKDVGESYSIATDMLVINWSLLMVLFMFFLHLRSHIFSDCTKHCSVSLMVAMWRIMQDSLHYHN